MVAAGFAAHVAKPADPEQLAATLLEVLASRAWPWTQG